mmetsp:Transcript_79842/g.175105  ORF Transcript_79842/g.175105 Transcript_79842/m.175105 type:complete len:249 (-) Transcript_79842:100-846(-)
MGRLLMRNGGRRLSGRCRPTLAGPPKIARVSPELTEWKAQGSIQTEVPNRSQVYCKTLQGWVETGERKTENSTDGKTYMWVEDQVGVTWPMLVPNSLLGLIEEELAARPEGEVRQALLRCRVQLGHLLLRQLQLPIGVAIDAGRSHGLWDHDEALVDQVVQHDLGWGQARGLQDFGDEVAADARLLAVEARVAEWAVGHDGDTKLLHLLSQLCLVPEDVGLNLIHSRHLEATFGHFLDLCFAEVGDAD